ncbi:glycosyltransferase [Stenotrophomonas oahuensis]|uniref:Glycosyltransferase n=1 Tax=Stenotrophomonas oahuensis TaxID=3003271 RepID=A0ABY9YJA5_9GAMM|nr:glycosyltransferase [Stenotrophomonas sp. A5586]WNH50782.1 glycosyltransferase [Stenotrophomonas sp. A5586]
MRVLIDLQGCQTESRFRGIGRYSLSLAQAMARNAGDHEIWVAVNASFPEGIEEIRAGLDGLVPQERIRAFHTLREVGWPHREDAWRREASERMWETFLQGLQPDIIHVSSLFEGSQGGAVTSIGKLGSASIPTAVTLYDLIPLLNPDTYLGSEWVRSWYMDKVESLKRASLLLSISEHARSEALAAMEFEPSRIVNMSSAISPHFVPKAIGEAERTLLQSRFGIIGDYVMYSGAMEPRKNAERLLEAFASLGPAHLAKTQMVIAGKIAPHDRARFDALVTRLGIADRVVLTGFITDEELILLYSGTSAYVFPSLHEGFGLPALEAMACGAPTIGSATTSVPEVIGRADALFDPADTDDIARSLRRVLEDADFAASLREHAAVQATRFSWDATAVTALKAMEAVVAGRPAQVRSWPASGEAVHTGYDALINALGRLTAAAEPSEEDLRDAAVAIAGGVQANEQVARAGTLPDVLKWRIEGPFDSTYSLALVNRCLAEALSARGHQVVLHSTEGPGDFAASPAFLQANPAVARLHEKEPQLPAAQADVSSRLLYPPRVADMQSRVNALHLYPWEESGFPQPWMEDFNAHLQGLSCVSEHVRKIMVDNGAGIPLTVCWNGVDHWEQVQAASDYAVPGKSRRFLHVSSCFPRKGVDVLLKAYGQAFTARDDVSLIIKTFANPHNEVHRWLEEAKRDHPAYPEVIIIEGDISDAQLKQLYAGCHALVAPSRAEGFGLPMAEAMLMGLPVITTAWGGQMDFCTPETAWLVDYTYVAADTHFNLYNSVWAEPDAGSLATALREVHDATPAQVKARTEAARDLLMARFKWSDVAAKLEQDVRHFASAPALPKGKVGWVTTWNTRCGVASYTANLVACLAEPGIILAGHAQDRTFEDDDTVLRCWQQGEGDMLEELSQAVERMNLDVLIIQFQYAFFDFPAFAAFLEAQKQAGRVVIVMMHATVDAAENPRKKLRHLAPALSRCDRILVHTVHDLNRLKAVGVDGNTALFPHGIMATRSAETAARSTAVHVASYGFFLPHKGLLELIDAVALLVGQGVDVHLSMINAEYPVDVSRDQIAQARSKIEALGLASRVRMVNDFLREEDSLAELVKADVVVFPYQGTGESSSAAVRYGLASGRPVAVTPLAIFDDVGEIVHRLPGTAPADLAAGLSALVSAVRANDPLVAETQQRAARWRAEHSYPALSRRLENMARQLLQDLQQASPSYSASNIQEERTP